MGVSEMSWRHFPQLCWGLSAGLSLQLHDQLVALSPGCRNSLLPISSHSHPSVLLCSHCYLCWSLQQGETCYRGNGVSSSTVLPYDLAKRKLKGFFLKASCFLQGEKEVSLGGRIAEKDRCEQGAYDMRNYPSDLLPFPQTDPFNTLGTISV